MGILRKIMIENRNRIDRKEEREAVIEERLFELIGDSTDRVFIYASTGSEVGTKHIIERLLEQGRHVFCPKVLWNRDIAFFEIHSYGELKPGYYDIPEPVIEEEGVEMEDILRMKEVEPDPEGNDLVVVPGVTFDEQGNRMGYGAGMYDRYLMAHPMFKVALAFEAQVYYPGLDESDEFDVPMDMLITEEKVRNFTEGS